MRLNCDLEWYGSSEVFRRGLKIRPQASRAVRWRSDVDLRHRDAELPQRMEAGIEPSQRAQFEQARRNRHHPRLALQDFECLLGDLPARQHVRSANKQFSLMRFQRIDASSRHVSLVNRIRSAGAVAD